MRERPILFSGEMVRAILAGRKTQTRRVIKPQPSNMDEWSGMGEFIDGRYGFQNAVGNDYFCPLGKPGDRLWVRETWGMSVRRDGAGGTGEFITHKADDPDAIYCSAACGTNIPIKWHPSIHMPRWASRITLEITDVRVERVQDITEEDAVREGIISTWSNYGHMSSDPRKLFIAFSEKDGGYSSAKEAYENLWNFMYSKRGFGWDANPWVWVISFKVIS